MLIILLLANNAKDLLKFLKLLEPYCSLNGLSINANKTKIMIFRITGKLKTDDVERFLFKEDKILTISRYKYLEGMISSSMFCPRVNRFCN